MKLRNMFCFMATLVVVPLIVSCAGKGFERNVHRHVLDNGLSLYTVEDHAVPLVYIEIAVRTGAIDQTPETAGLFHLYEHMMFKGNALYRDAASVQQAMTDMGIANWNGTTGRDCVNYFFTIPSDQLENGLAFWNAAIRSPLLDEAELENEKKVVLNEIMGDAADPDQQFSDYISWKLFPDAPYRVDSGGSFPVVEGATVAQLRDIQQTYYIPKNAALFVGGDISEKETRALVERIFGTWSNNGHDVPAKPAQQAREPFAEPLCVVMPSDKVPPQLANMLIAFRGPDADYDLQDTYAADYLLTLEDEPGGLFKTMLLADEVLGIPQGQYIWSGFATTRASGLLYYGASLTDPQEGLPARALRFLEDVRDRVMPALAAEESLYTAAKSRELVSAMRNEFAVSTDTVQDALRSARIWWVTTTPDYFDSYYDRLQKVTQKDAAAFVQEYLTGKQALVAVQVNPDVYEATQAEYAAAGFTVVTEENAFWWKEPRFAPDAQKIAAAGQGGNAEVQEIYRPGSTGGTAGAVAGARKSDTARYELRNGISVYVRHDKGRRVATVQLGIRGGIAHLTPETSGLEGALLEIMASSSESYGIDAREQIFHDTSAEISHSSWMTGSVLSLFCLDTDVQELLPVLVDGFLHPAYEGKAYDMLLDGYRQSVQRTLNDPESYLFYTMGQLLYAGHPYEGSTGVTPLSLNAITVENMRRLEPVLRDPAALFVVAAGNVDGQKLVRALNKTIGALEPVEGSPATLADVPPVRVVPQEPVVLTSQAVAGSGYAVRGFAAPPNTSADYMPALLAASVYSDILFNVVRERNGICYTPYSYIVGSKAPLGYEELISLSDYERFVPVMAEARSLMAAGKVISGRTADGGYSLASLEQSLPAYKNKCITSLYGSQGSTAGSARMLAYDIMQFDDPEHGQVQLEQVHAATAEDVLRVFRTYWVDGAGQWFAIVGPQDEAKLSFAED